MWGVRRSLMAGCVLAAEAALLFGCADLPHDTPIAAAARGCLDQNKRFTDAWGCVQARNAASQEPDARSKAFLKLGDELASAVAVKSLTDAAARQRLIAQLPLEDTGIMASLNQIANPPASGAL